MASDPVIHVIDDDDGARHSLKFLLECAGYSVRDHASAVAFLSRLTANGDPRGCIVTDVRMPEMSGVELIGRLKALGIDEPIIVITGHADVPMAIQAMKAGVSDFIEKPYSDDVLLSAVRTALERRSERAAADRERSAAQALLAALSPRETEVLDGLVEGKPNKVIAADLGISVRTVEVYRANVMTKMQVKSLSELVRLALRAQG